MTKHRIDLQQTSRTSIVRGKSIDPYEKTAFGTKGNIYCNTYYHDSNRFLALKKIFLRWRGSVYRLVWEDLLFFFGIYYLLTIVYRGVLVAYPVHKQHFELLCVYADRFSSPIPITFLTGFYVSNVVSRWWDQFMALPYPDQLALKLVSFIPENVSIS